MFSLKGKNAFITGGTAGIGKAVAASYVQAGAKVIIAGRRDEGEAVAGEIGATFYKLDVADELAVQDTMIRAKEDLGALDILVANAGVARDDAFIENSASADIKMTFEINFHGSVYCLKYGVPIMNDGGAVIITASVAGKMGFPGEFDYSASKAALCSLVQNAAIEFGARGIRVNGVCPGGILTDMALPEELFQTLTPIGRMGKPEDVIGLYNLLAADEGSYINGQNINLDGGLSVGFSIQSIEKILSA